MAEAIKVARAVKKALQCDGVYLTQANEPAARQDVFHYHLHVYWCWGDRVRRAISDFVGSVTDRENVTEEMKAAMAEKVRQGLANLSKAFRNVILGHGPMPMEILERVAEDWIETQG